MRENAVIFDPERKLFLYLGLVVLAVVLGPFGTYDKLALSPRVTFWALDILGTAIIMVAVLHVFYYSRFTTGIPPVPRLLLAIAIGAVPGSAYVSLICDTIGVSLHINLPLPQVYLHIVVLATLVFTAEFVVWPKVFGDHSWRPRQHPAASAPATFVRPNPFTQHPLFDRIPANLRGGRLISISMQDHYAQIVTTRGEHLLLMRLRDAMDLVSDLPGARVHRSHWVAAEFADTLERNGRRHALVLLDGRKLPVSATYLDAARALVEDEATQAAAQ